MVNMAVSISAKDLYNKCKDEALKELNEEEIPSLLWFKFQFWPKCQCCVKLHGSIESSLYDPTKNDT